MAKRLDCFLPGGRYYLFEKQSGGATICFSIRSSVCLCLETFHVPLLDGHTNTGAHGSHSGFLSVCAAGGDSIDSSVTYMGLFSEQLGCDLWTLVQNQPHHFSVGGLYYRQAQRDVGLGVDKHFTFPSLPGKVSGCVISRVPGVQGFHV